MVEIVRVMHIAPGNGIMRVGADSWNAAQDYATRRIARRFSNPAVRRAGAAWRRITAAAARWP
jgi:hypothetical protein